MRLKSLPLAIFAAAAVLVGAGQSLAADYAVILKTLSNPFWVQMKEGIEAKAKELKVTVDIFASPSEGDLQSQLQLFEDVLNKPYKGVAFAPLSPVNLIQPAAKAYKKGMFLINLDEKIDMESLKQAGANVEGFITTDNVKVGASGADFILRHLGKAGGKVAIIEGKAGNASGEARRKGAAGAFSAQPSIEVVASQPADWDRLRALDVATNILQTTPDLKAFYVANDTMALGAMQAVQNVGKKGQVMIVGTDGIPEARDMVKAGRLTATVAQDPAGIGAKGLEMLVVAAQSGKRTAVGAEAKIVTVDSVLISGH